MKRICDRIMKFSSPVCVWNWRIDVYIYRDVSHQQPICTLIIYVISFPFKNKLYLQGVPKMTEFDDENIMDFSESTFQ